MTIIQKANELIEERGHEEAKKEFKKLILAIGEPSNFEQICIISGYEVAIEHINKRIELESKNNRK